ncbi:uncharacterized protein BP01DRAFT_352754 [Aspergillus saccharolyticus JOP 1030-1]|uniref:Uncharacterized protein n=1 Tax=Aspergillus saccharolyticus JOP 1030-1 TaxID=1450539 RepID=A0A318ZNV9_9EURO|nr:hypothetical protein BP01DRAFT_352754 [Aspergillus saccharolyticus JOP 1030-1]PYH49226.1 hypothetical protein BP01DRAFT_352754 [Aspergillus saccharolyticus JOP 1030-1]
MATAQLSTSGSGVPTRLPTDQEAQEYEKILKISDEIFLGTHPRLKVPQQFVRKPASRNPPASSTPSQVKPGEPQKASPKKYTPSAPSNAKAANPSSGGAAATSSGAPGASRIIPNPASEIDPIFLTKSDDLVRAELQLQRQRVERALREQLEQKRQESRQKAALQDAKPDFDVSDVLVKAFEMVNPSPSVDGRGNGEPSDSFDENSFYSSRAPDSPQQGDPQGPSSAPQSTSEEPATEGPVENYSDELQRLEALNRTGLDQDMQDTYPVTGHRVPYDQRQPHHGEVDYASRKYPTQPQSTDAFEEPEYSPPAPGVAPMEREDNHEAHREHPAGTKRRAPEGRPVERARYARRSISPGDDVRIVRNHITSPAAPQPSRVSPLAITKVSSVPQSRSDYAPERHTSPDVPAYPLTSRKRRRLHEDRDRSRPSYKALNTGPAAETYIKEEPVSPPPFADDPQAYRSRHPQERPVYIDIASPQYTPVIERREAPMRESGYEYEVYDAHADPGAQRTISRLSVRRPMRDDQDLRRVASLQHQARQPEYAREYIDQASPHTLRAGSYAIVERPAQERIRFYDEVPPPPARRYIPAAESPMSPRLREAYYEEEATGRMMAPPPRRIVVDEHGNQYYEAVSAPRVQAMPFPASRAPRSDVYDDRAVSLRHASLRAASVVEDPYGGRRYVPDMPPPPKAYRRVTDYARPIPGEGRPYTGATTAAVVAGQDERDVYPPRSASVQVAEYAPRRPQYYLNPEEAEVPRERIVRMPSVRPPAAGRYEEPREIIQRVDSVRPGGVRDVSVYLDDGTRPPREYVERPMYVATRPVMTREEPIRYYEGGVAANPERVVLEGTPRGDVVHRAPPRY